MNKRLVHITAVLLILSILATSIIPVLAKPSPKLEKKVIIHYKKGYGKPPGTPGKGPDKDKTDEDGSYVLLAKGVMWKTTENILVDTNIPTGLTQGFVTNTIATSAQTWQNNASYDLYGLIETSSCNGIDTDTPDGLNEIMFGDYPDEGVIAVTIIWGIFSGPPSKREIVEFDMLFDIVDFTWGDCEIDPSVMDLQNIATHELGHAFGLGDLYNTADNLETMYGYSSEGETIKRDLYYGDVAGIQSLYGAP